MKRKFAFNIAPAKVAAKVEVPLPVQMPPAPQQTPTFRRQLPPDVEAELRKACAVILQNFKPSSQIYEEQVLAATFASLQKSTHLASDQEQQPRQARRGREALRRLSDGQKGVELPLSLDTSKYRYKPDTALKDLFVEADSTHTLVQASIIQPQDSSRSASAFDPLTPAVTAVSRTYSEPIRQPKVKTPNHERPRTANRGESYETTSSTPQTLASDYHSASTALTSAHFTPSANSKRGSEHAASEKYSSSAGRAGPVAAQWMKQELERRGRVSESQPRASSEQQHRPPSRGSIRSGISEYFRPSSALSRSSSQDSGTSAAPARPPTATGWRSWSLTRKRSNASARSSRPGSATGRREDKGVDPLDVNLNRELPPLPGLNTYDERKSSPKMHIAALMRSKKSRKPENEQFISMHAAKSTEAVVPLRSYEPRLAEPWSTFPLQNQPRKQHSPGAPINSSRMPFLEPARAPEDYHPIERPKTVGGMRQTSMNGFARSSSPPRRHSRHISLEHYAANNASLNSFDRAYRRAIQINTVPSPNTETKGRSNVLKKLFGRTKKEPKPLNWMAQMERIGVKGGILEDYGNAAPIVRF